MNSNQGTTANTNTDTNTNGVSDSSAVTNFMAGRSFEVNPLLTLKLIAASGIFGEPKYYIKSETAPRTATRSGNEQSATDRFTEYLMFIDPDSPTVEDIFIRRTREALDFNFQGTLELARDLRREFNMRLNPQVILVLAAMHPGRAEFNRKNGSLMKELGQQIIQRPDDILFQLDFYISQNGGKKNGLPNILKKIWAAKLTGFDAYRLRKYKSKLIDCVRLCHAGPSRLLDQLMRTGTVEVREDEMTWETLKAQGKNWNEILDQLKERLPHMALLRNLRAIGLELGGYGRPTKQSTVFDWISTALSAATGGTSSDQPTPEDARLQRLLDRLVAGVPGGKQFPFRYYTCYLMIKEESNFRENTRLESVQKSLLDALESCMMKALENLPRLPGKTLCLCDNSGSAQNTTVSSYSRCKTSTIANLSSIITAYLSDEGEIGLFGDNLLRYPIDPQKGLLQQLEMIEKDGCHRVGQATEAGIWKALHTAIKKQEHWDHIFIYSDMQAGHGGLYGRADYGIYNLNQSSRYHGGAQFIDVLKMINDYRCYVNPKVNVFSVQVAGYDNSVTPELFYRGAVLAGWTGAETVYASQVAAIWDSIEERKT